MKRIVANKARCNHCKDELESKFPNEEKECSCGRVRIKGGQKELIRFAHSKDDFTELSIEVHEDEETAQAS